MTTITSRVISTVCKVPTTFCDSWEDDPWVQQYKEELEEVEDGYVVEDEIEEVEEEYEEEEVEGKKNKCPTSRMLAPLTKEVYVEEVETPKVDFLRPYNYVAPIAPWAMAPREKEETTISKNGAKKEVMENEFPSLVASQKIDGKTLSRIIEQKEKAVKQTETVLEQRNKAFQFLSNKEELAKKLVKSKFCRNILEHGKCYRKVCTFAHSLEELSPAKCAFGDVCKFQKSKTKTCGFIHPCETKDGFCKRTGVVIPLKK